MEELLTRDTALGEYLLNEVDKMLHEHVPFKEIAKEVTTLARKDANYMEITEGDIKQYACKHFFEEVKPTTVDDIKDFPEAEFISSPEIEKVAEKISKKTNEEKRIQRINKRMQTTKPIREKIEHSRDTLKDFCKNPDKKPSYTIAYFVTLLIVLALYYISLKSGYYSLYGNVKYGIGDALPSLLYVTVIYTVLFRYVLPFIYSAITFIILLFI